MIVCRNCITGYMAVVEVEHNDWPGRGNEGLVIVYNIGTNLSRVVTGRSVIGLKCMTILQIIKRASECVT
jgi:hypothetical protein